MSSNVPHLCLLLLTAPGAGGLIPILQGNWLRLSEGEVKKYFALQMAFSGQVCPSLLVHSHPGALTRAHQK